MILVGVLVGLEGLMSLDNALVLGLLARRLPGKLQAKALTYGLVGAFAFRIIAVCMAAALLRWQTAKLLGGGYLVFVAARHLFFHTDGDDPQRPATGKTTSFWKTVGAIELTDVAFAADSILAGIALIGNPQRRPDGSLPPVNPKLWVVVVGGLAGVVLMRFAAMVFIRLLKRFPRFETSAYLLVLLIGAKMLVDWACNHPGAPARLDFHDPGEPAFWMFWSLMAAGVLYGFIPPMAKTPAVTSG